MKIVFRTDANTLIGTGHFMRCMTLAEHLSQRGCQIRFVCRGLPEHMQSMLVLKGIEIAPLGEGNGEDVVEGDLAHSHWLPIEQEADVQATRLAMTGHSWDWLIVDHYALDARWESAMRPYAKKIMVIDDLADRTHDCDVLLDQNYYSGMQMRYEGKVPMHCQLLLGPRYVLLRDEFIEQRKRLRPRAEVVKKIMIFFGGADANNYTQIAIKALSELEISNFAVDVVIGAQHPALEEISQVCAALGYHCHVQTSRMAELMAEADLAIGAGGGAVWERCCLGLPSLSICVAENQRKQLEYAARKCLLLMPDIAVNLLESIKVHIRAMMENAALREVMYEAGMKLVDGAGVQRASRVVQNCEIKIRQANDGDTRNLFEWRNHPDIRGVSSTAMPIKWEAHKQWLTETLLTRSKEILIGSDGENPIGVVRFDISDDLATVSIYLVPEGGFEGQGRNLLMKAESWLTQHRPEVSLLRAVVLEINQPSKRMFLGAGYRRVSLNFEKKIESNR